MPELFFLPALPLPSNQIIWFGVLLVAGVVGGEIAKRAFFLPRITGYVAAGLALGPDGFALLGSRCSTSWACSQTSRSA